MIIYAVGNEADSYAIHLVPIYSATAVSSTADYGISVTPAGWARLDFSVAVSQCWSHFNFAPSSTILTTNQPFWGLMNKSTGKLALRLIRDDTSELVFQYNNTGTTYTTIATIWGDLTLNSIQKIDVFFKNGASGELKVFVDGIKAIDVSGNYTTVDSTWDSAYFASPRAANIPMYFGDVFITDEPVFRGQLHSLNPDIDGTVNTWVGNYTKLAGSSGKVDKSKAVYTDSIGESALFGFDAISSLSSRTRILGVSISYAASIDSSSSVSDVALLVRHSATTYQLDSFGLIADNGVMRGQQNLELNPSSGNWSEVDVNSLEVGVISE